MCISTHPFFRETDFKKSLDCDRIAPMDCSPITDTLYLGTTPESEDYNRLRDLGITLVINMRIEQRPHPDQHNEPMRVIHYRTIDHPFLPIPMKKARALRWMKSQAAEKFSFTVMVGGTARLRWLPAF